MGMIKRDSCFGLLDEDGKPSRDWSRFLERVNGAVFSLILRANLTLSPIRRSSKRMQC